MRPGALDLGSHVIELLIPQRAPMLMVDRVDAYVADPPTLHASRHVTSNEIFFQGHFPGMHIWPGCLTIEGMGQTASLLVAVGAVRAALATPDAPDAGLDALRNLERRARLHPGYDAEAAATMGAAMAAHAPPTTLGASVDVKLVQPVFPGQRLEYRARLVLASGNFARFEVEATVNDVTVASGFMTGMQIPRRDGPGGAG